MTLKKLLIIIYILFQVVLSEVKQDVQFLNELPLDKLLKIKSSIKHLVKSDLDSLENATTTTPVYHSFGAEAMAVQAQPKTPIKRGDYEESWHKGGGSSKISNIFSMSVTTLAFLAFGGYLLCLIVHAVRQKQMYYNPMFAPTTVAPATFFVSAGIKKRPQPQFASYGRKRREYREGRSMRDIIMDMPPEQLFSALLQLCEGYAKWSGKFGNDSFVY